MAKFRTKNNCLKLDCNMIKVQSENANRFESMKSENAIHSAKNVEKCVEKTAFNALFGPY